MTTPKLHIAMSSLQTENIYWSTTVFFLFYHFYYCTICQNAIFKNFVREQHLYIGCTVFWHCIRWVAEQFAVNYAVKCFHMVCFKWIGLIHLPLPDVLLWTAKLR